MLKLNPVILRGELPVNCVSDFINMSAALSNAKHLNQLAVPLR